MSATLIFERAGAMTTIQDKGRFGAQALGVPVSGALDPVSLQLANALVGNPEGAPAFEMRLLGPRFRVKGGPVRVALVGADAALEVTSTDTRRVPPGRSATLKDGDVAQIGAIMGSACATLAVSGTFDLPEHFGSLSTYVPSGLGGVHGRAVSDGDRIDMLGAAPQGPDCWISAPLTQDDAAPFRIVFGPQADFFTDAAFQTLTEANYVVSPMSNRMGLRLDGPKLEHKKGYNIPSDGIVNGAIQAPGSGLPIVLMADRQTTGGYPKIATVISADLPRLGRLMPGATLRFQAVTVEQAVDMRRDLERSIRSACESIHPVVLSGEALAERLLSENLISGVVSCRAEPLDSDAP